MAKVVIEFDTNEKTLAVSIDGAAIENVVGAEVYRRGYYGYGPPEDGEADPEFAFSVMQAESDKANDMTKMTRIAASLGQSKTVLASAKVKQTEKAVADIINYFNKD